MKRVLLTCLIAALCLVPLTACAKKGTSVQPSQLQSQSPGPSTTSPSAANTNTASASPSPSSIIVAESSNAISDKQKQAVLDNLTKELDDAFDSSGKLEDLDDSDLNTNNIE